MIDPAMCRPGRLDRLLYVDLPSPDERLDILQALTKMTPLATSTDPQDLEHQPVRLELIAHDHRADGYSGADLASLVREAAVTALREKIVSPLQYTDDSEPVERVLVYQNHFVHAFDRVQPSVTPEQRLKYEALRSRIASGSTRSGQALK